MHVSLAASPDVAFHWLLFGHLVGVAVLGAGLGGYVVGLHRLAAARTVADLRGASPVLAWGERVALVGYGLLIVTGIGLGVKASAFDDAWLLTSLATRNAASAASRLDDVIREVRQHRQRDDVLDPVAGVAEQRVELGTGPFPTTDQ